MQTKPVTHLTLAVYADVQTALPAPGAVYGPRGELADQAGTDGPAGQGAGLGQVRVRLPAVPAAVAVPPIVVGSTLGHPWIRHVYTNLECKEWSKKLKPRYPRLQLTQNVRRCADVLLK